MRHEQHRLAARRRRLVEHAHPVEPAPIRRERIRRDESGDHRVIARVQTLEDRPVPPQQRLAAGAERGAAGMRHIGVEAGDVAKPAMPRAQAPVVLLAEPRPNRSVRNTPTASSARPAGAGGRTRRRPGFRPSRPGSPPPPRTRDARVARASGIGFGRQARGYDRIDPSLLSGVALATPGADARREAARASLRPGSHRR